MGAPILIMAGGTGGHVFPALAVARALRNCNEEIVWLGSGHGIENELVPGEGITLESTRVSGLRGKGLLSWLAAPFKLGLALADAMRVLSRRRPKLVLGMGGFVAGPGGLAAWLLRRPLIIHEQNSVAGLTNRLLARFAREVLTAFPGAFSAGIKTRLVGNPVRAEIAALPAPEVRFANRSGPLRLLVLGGSQGARVLNETVPLAGARLNSAELDVWHQCGAADLDSTSQAYRDNSISARVDGFIEDMAEAYAWADVVVCRAGALTVSELSAAGVGAVFVPYPSAVDDHQTRNARFMVDAAAATLLPQNQLNAESLAAELGLWLADRRLVLDRATAARSLARPDATAEVVQLCLATAIRS